MSAMGDLRLSLLEHGVNYDEYGDGYTHWNYGGASYTAQQNIVGKLIVCNLTPEQAIDATLGRGECEWVLEHSGTLYDKWRCSKCEFLFVEPRCDQGYTDLEPTYCPRCGRKIKS